jgi:hypothetical protein
MIGGAAVSSAVMESAREMLESRGNGEVRRKRRDLTTEKRR